MPERNRKESIAGINQAVQQAVKVETSYSVQRSRAWLFGFALVLIMIVFAGLTFLVVTTPSFPIDLQITQAIQTIDSPWFAGLMIAISWPGFSPQSILITLLIAFVLYTSGLRWESLTSLLAGSFSGLTNELVKNLIKRPRPAADLVEVFSVLTSYSFPSGHVMFYMILFGFVGYLAYTLLKRSMKRTVVLGLSGGLILIVGVSRIYLGQHWASDVLGAYLLGGLVLIAIVLLHRWGRKHFFLSPAVESHTTNRE